MDKINKTRAVLRARVSRFRVSCSIARAERELEETRRRRKSDRNDDYETVSAQFIGNSNVKSAGDVEVITSSAVNCDAPVEAGLCSADAPMEIDFNPDDPLLKLKEDLKKWIIGTNIARTSVDSLLKIFKGPIPSLPSSYKSSFVFDVKNYSDGSQFVYFGLEQGLRRCINPDIHSGGETLPLQIFLDGFSPYKSSNIQMGPLLGRIHHG
ncbi:hypothetical protein QAD02_003832 [Eretmocerus hayati]|uniref:Uncharacterized protein n=1 Tax=Eretmocerus hayati TaxID=131215 RepID=A0ACC2NP21_9HYME|nr:hypothetical protein QAD02_003832 [Eretmocerus hayati]